MNWNDVVKGHNAVFIGESGCGKTELAINCAITLRQSRDNVVILDMDQTKGAYRCRDHKDLIEGKDIKLLAGLHFMDSPIVPPGVERLLKDENSMNVLDIGGNETGALTVGQYSEYLDGSTVFYVVNPYRLLSADKAHIEYMQNLIMAYGGFRQFITIGNPNIGNQTDSDIVLEGIHSLEEMQLGCSFYTVSNKVEMKAPLPENTILIDTFTIYP